MNPVSQETRGACRQHDPRRLPQHPPHCPHSTCAPARLSSHRWDLAALDAAVRESQKRRHLVAGTLSIGTPAPWDYQPRRDASREYVRNTLALDDIEAKARFPRVRPRAAAP